MAVKSNSLRLESAETSGKYKEASHALGFPKAGSGRRAKTFNYKTLTAAAEQRELSTRSIKKSSVLREEPRSRKKLTCNVDELFINPQRSGYFPF